MKRTALALILFLGLLLSILAAMELVEIVEANPFFMFDYIEPIPDAIPPTITIYNPMNSAISSSDIVTVSLNVKKPEQSGWISSVAIVEYSLDNSVPVQIYCYMWPNEGSGTPEFGTNFSLYLLSAGKHSLNIEAVAAVRSWKTMEIFWLRSSSMVFFTVGTEAFRPAITSIVLSVAGGIVLLVHFKKRKH